MPSIIKVDQIQSDQGFVNVSSNLQFSSGFTMLSPSLSSPTLTTPTTSGVMTLGAGIKFPATQVADADANTLDDYEEGTFTPSMGGSSSDPTISYTTQLGRYTKIGNLVYFNILIIISSVSAQGVGNILIKGLPFAEAGSNYEFVCPIGYNDVFDTAFPSAYVSGTSLQVIPAGVTQANAGYGSPASGSQSNLSSGYLAISGFYPA